MRDLLLAVAVAYLAGGCAVVYFASQGLGTQCLFAAVAVGVVDTLGAALARRAGL